MLPTDPGLRRRILLATALVIVLPFAFIYAFEASVNHVLLPLMESLGGGPSDWRLDVNPVWAAVLVGAALAGQAVFGPATILRDIGASPVLDQWRPEVQDTVARLAQQVDLEAPDLAVVTSDAPNAAAVSGPLGDYVVVTTGLLETLDDDEFTAVLAHEVAHLKNRDSTVMTVAWLLPTVTYTLAIGTVFLLSLLFQRPSHRTTSTHLTHSRANRGVLKALAILVITAIVTLALSVMFWIASVLVHRVLGRYREYAADRGAVALTGDPATLASALRTIDETMPDVPDGDLRRLDGGAEALYFAPLDGRAFSHDGIASTDIFPATHPPTERRIERLGELTRDLE